MGFWLSWNVEDNVKMQVFVDNAAADNKESPVGVAARGEEEECPVVEGGPARECPARHGTKRKLEEEETEMKPGGNKTKTNRVYVVHRQSIFNISVCKLNRYRQAADPSLRRSVLICNTLRTIEREMVSEGLSPSPPLALLPSIDTDKITLDPIPPPVEASSASSTAYFNGLPVAPVLCRDNELGYEKSLTDLDSVSGRATPYPSTNNSNNHVDLNQSRSAEEDDVDDDETHRFQWDSTAVSTTSSSNSLLTVSSSSSSSSSSSCSSSDRVTTTATISWSSVLSFPSQNELVTSSSSVSEEDVWPSSNNAYFDGEVSSNSGNGGCGAETGAGGGGGPNTSPSASSDSGISTASDEIFGDIDLSLYDFDLVPLSPPNTARAAPPSAEELLRSFPPTGGGQSIIHHHGPTGGQSILLPPSPFNTLNRHSRSSYEAMAADNDFEHVMHVMPAPP